MSCRWCVDDAFALLVEWGFSPTQASALLASRSTVFLVPGLMTENDRYDAGDVRTTTVRPGHALSGKCECERTDHPSSPDGRCNRDGDGAERMTDGKVSSSPALCIPCLFCCTEDDE